jgi:hypothetical protein
LSPARVADRLSPCRRSTSPVRTPPSRSGPTRRA